MQVTDGSGNVETVDLQPDFDQAKAADWHFRWWFNDDANGNTAYAADDPIQGYGVTFRVNNGDSLFNAYHASEPNALGRFLDAIKIPLPIEPPASRLGETPEGNPIYGPGAISEPPYMRPPIVDPIDTPICECFVAPCDCGAPRPPYATGFPGTPPPSVPITGGNGGNSGNGQRGPGLVFWLLVGAGIYALTKD
jgi:hypothetical protein